MRQQIPRFALPREQTGASLLERRLRFAFLNTPVAIGRRPEPRAIFDNTARDESPARPWRSFGLPLRSVARTARAIGGPVVDRTRHEIVVAVLAFLAWVLEPLEDGVPVEAVVYFELMREQAEALEAQALAKGLGTDEATERAIRETEEAITAQRGYLGALTRAHAFPRPMGATPLMEIIR